MRATRVKDNDQQRSPTSDRANVSIGRPAHLRHHRVAKLFQGWLQWRNREQFEIYCYGIDINNTGDNFTKQYQEQSDYFYQFDNLVNGEKIAQHILARLNFRSL
ncbi:hypothetical protein MiAbW_03198 [Microcystis aeruginosa NIES-4325]|uniref:Uncharacterized protein n=1 Tax=Microcystis aeruginosa NIES-4325 TaxID=2569534 RepID=A0A5J4FBC8_MICAE|nr:hypothetical protein [Microcystis aeruginosa]GEA28622.1 hypothetical protein MiAbW_03198 [Microcystis aeruginosa NIES-4325]